MLPSDPHRYQVYLILASKHSKHIKINLKKHTHTQINLEKARWADLKQRPLEVALWLPFTHAHTDAPPAILTNTHYACSIQLERETALRRGSEVFGISCDHLVCRGTQSPIYFWVP